MNVEFCPSVTYNLDNLVFFWMGCLTTVFNQAKSVVPWNGGSSKNWLDSNVAAQSLIQKDTGLSWCVETVEWWAYLPGESATYYEFLEKYKYSCCSIEHFN